MQHRGEIVKEAIYKSGVPISVLAQRLGKSRRWVYQMFDNNNVSLDVILQIGLLIHYDFTEEIKEFNPSQKMMNPSSITYEKDENNAEYWKNKYLKLLEEFNELLKSK